MRVLLITYDNDSHISYFPLGVAYIASYLKNNGHCVQIYSQDVNHYPEEHLINFLNNNSKFDVVGIGVVGGYYQFRKLLKLSNTINNCNNRPDLFVLGGHGPSPEPEFFLKKTNADVIVIGEGEETIVDLLNNIKNLENVKGIAYKKDNKIYVNERRDLIKDIDKILYPAYDLFPIETYRLCREPNCNRTDFVMPVLSGRGCRFTCNFCYRMDKGLRIRGNKSIIEEITYLKEKYKINYISFMDELLMSSKERIISLCEDFIDSNLNFKWSCNGRLNYASENIIKIMKKAGCVFINYGVESLDNKVLKLMNKSLTEKIIINGVENTLKYGISPGLNMIFGNLGDNKKTLEKSVNFLLKYNDFSQLRTIRPMTPYPGSPIYYYAIKNKMLNCVEDFYLNKHLNSDLLTINFTEMSNDEFYKCLFEANKILVEKYFDNKKESYISEMNNLYFNGNSNFRGFREV